MKALIPIFLLTVLFIACERDRSYNYVLNDGVYMGTYYYQNRIYFSEIEIDSNRYEEWPSGGFIYQKSDLCLTVGKYSISGDILSFKPDSFKYKMPNYECTTEDMVLSGDFNLTVFGESDSIKLSRGRGSHSIYYHLKKIAK
jgi:hypothetical protein